MQAVQGLGQPASNLGIILISPQTLLVEVLLYHCHIHAFAKGSCRKAECASKPLLAIMGLKILQSTDAVHRKVSSCLSNVQTQHTCRWVKPDVVENRVWIRDGKIHLIPLPSALNPRLPAQPSLPQSLQILQSDVNTIAPTTLQVSQAPVRLSLFTSQSLPPEQATASTTSGCAMRIPAFRISLLLIAKD